MSKKIRFRPKDFQKFHQKEKLEVLVLSCPTCKKLTTHIFHGKENNKFIYGCMYCDATYESSKKLKEYNLKNLKNG